MCNDSVESERSTELTLQRTAEMSVLYTSRSSEAIGSNTPGDEVQGAVKGSAQRGRSCAKFENRSPWPCAVYRMPLSSRLKTALSPWRSIIASHAQMGDAGLVAGSAVGCDAMRCASSLSVEPPAPPGNVAPAANARHFHTSTARLAIAQNTAMDIFDRFGSAVSPFACRRPDQP